MPKTCFNHGRFVRFIRLRAVALIAVLAVMSSFLTLVSPPTARAADPMHPTPTCSAGTTNDTCTITGSTATSVTISYTVVFSQPGCQPSTPKGCTYSVASTWEATGAGTKATHNASCPWKQGITNGSDYSTGFAPGATGFTCTDTWSWGANDYPADLLTVVQEQDGEGDFDSSTGQHRFDVNYPRPYPSPSFTYTADPNTRGLYHFTSTSTGSSPLTYRWEVNGDLDGSGPTFDFTFTASGTYSVDLEATDALNDSSHSVQSVNVTLNDLTAAISLTGANGQPFTGGATAVGQTLNATVSLANVSTSSDITGVSATPPLSVDPSTSLTLVSGPTPAVPATLPKGTTASYTMSYTVQTPGRAKLSAHVTGTEGSNAQFADAVTTANLGQPIKVVTTFLQNGQPIPSDTVKLADADDGEVPQDVQAVVTLTNQSSITQLGVNINGQPVPSFHTGTHALPSVPVSVTAGPPAGYVVGTLAPGATSAPLVYTLNVRDNGVFDLATQVLSYDETGTTTSVSTGQGTLTALPTALLWLSLKPVDTGAVQAGTQVEVRGTLTDRSETQAVFSNALEPASVTGNAGGGRLVDDTSPANLALATLVDGVQLPFLGRVEPGQKITLTGLIDTAQVPSTRATLTYQPGGQVINDDGSMTDLRSDQVGMATGTSPVTVAVSAADPAVPEADLQTEIQNFENSVVQGTGELAEANFRAALNFLQHPYDGTVKGVTAVAGAIVNSPRDLASAAYILASIDLYSTVYVTLTPQQRANFEAGILADFDASHVKADNAEVAKAIDAGFSSFADALAKHDYNRVASLAGTGTAIAGNAIATAVLTDVFFQKLSLGLKGLGNTGKAKVTGYLSNALVLADKADEAGLKGKIVKTIDGVKAGQNLLANHASALINAWGLTPEQYTKLIAFCKQNKLIIAVRSRSKRAAQLIARGLAVGKNEVLKVKGVNEFDVKWLGYSQADLNKLVNAEPIPYETLIDDLLRKHADRTTEALAIERWHLRYDEWHSPKVRGVMEKANAAKEIEWGFNGTDNGAPAADRAGKRRFALHQVKGYEMPAVHGQPRKPRVYEQVLVGNKNGPGGKLVGVTQDVDTAAILNNNNTIPTAALRTTFYEFLSDVLGIEHPETVSWINNGDILFAAKVKELGRLFEGGGEALAVFGPDGSVRAGFLNPSLTVYDAATKGGTIIFHGGYNNVYSKAAASVTVNLKKFF